MRPWAFKVRGGGNATGIKGGPVKAGIQGGVGALYSQDAVFTIATHQDQWIALPPLTDNQYQYSHQMNHPIGKPLRYLSVCSGMEAASVAWHPLGWTPVGFSEIEPFPCAILKHRFPNVPNYGSLTEHHTWPIEPGTIDLLVGGTPCQSYSVAGKRGGLNDPRGQLMLCFLDLAARLKPKYIIWENVPGVLSSGQPRGSDFATFLQGLAERGYGWAYRVLDAQHFGVPQRRRRVFVVACLGDWRAPAEVLSLREGLRGYLEAGGKKRKGVAADAGSGPASGCWWDGGQVSQTLDAVLSKGQTMPEKNRFPAVLQPYTASSFAQYAEGVGTVRASGGDLGGDLGGGSETLLAQPITFRKSKRAASTTDNETWVPADVTNTLNNFDLGDTRTTHAVVEPFAWTQNQREEVRILGDKAGAVTLPGTHQSNYIAEPVTHAMPGSVAPTVTSSGPPYSRTGNERVEAEALAITFQPGNLRREAGAEPSTTTTTTTLKASAGDQTPHVATPMAVRRLTPVECERLQGFPDNWSRIPWKGKPETECPDGPRYKACGNSMAVPCMFWIGKRIAEHEAQSNLKDA